MKRLSSLRLGVQSSSAALFLIATTWPLTAQTASKTEIQQSKAEQQEISTNTAGVVAQVQSLIDELQVNGISGDDVKVLQATKIALSHLSGAEMEKVIQSLQKASDAPDVKGTETNAINAYATQKGIILQFRQILKEYEQRQAAYELPGRFKELTGRQTDTMLTTVAVARDTAGKNAQELSSMDSTSQQIVQTDQDAIVSDVNLAVDQLSKAAQGSSGDDAKPMQAAQAELQTGKLTKALAQADSDLKAGHFLNAINDQKVARDELKNITKMLNPPATAVDALNATAADLAKILEAQEKLLDQTKSAMTNKVQVAGLNDKQASIVDDTDSVQKDMLAMSPAASALVKQAINPMQLSRSQLAELRNFPQASKAQDDAIEKLEEAQKQLQQQVADAEKAEADASKDSVAQLQDLQKQIQAAMQQQAQVTNQTNQAVTSPTPNPTDVGQAQQAQSQLQQSTAAMQQSSQALSLPASQALGNAAAQMAQAQQALNDPANQANAQQNQQAAQAALAQANQAVAAQISQAQQAAADPAALAAAANDLQQAQDNVSAAQVASSPSASSPSASSPSASSPSASSPSAASPSANAASPAASPAAAPSMAQATAALAAAAQNTNAAAATPGLPDAAAAAVADAQKDIGQGQQAAAQGNAAGTAAAAAAAQSALAQAQASVAMAQASAAAGAPSMAGGPPGPPGPPGPGMPAPGPPSMAPTPPGPDMPSMDGAKTVGGGNNDKNALHGVADDKGSFLTVAQRDRTAVGMSQGEKRPQEYAPLIDQYLKNLADQSSSATQ